MKYHKIYSCLAELVPFLFSITYVCAQNEVLTSSWRHVSKHWNRIKKFRRQT